MDPIRPYLLPLTRSLPTPLVTLGHSLLGPACYKTLVLDLDLASRACLSLALSKSLGLGIILLSSIVKIPQILKIVSSQSAQGISFVGVVLETTSYVVMLCYGARRGLPFTTYGETALIAVQDAVIGGCVLWYGGGGGGGGKGGGEGGVGRGGLVGAFAAVLAGAVYALQNERLVGMETLGWMQAGAGALGVASKVPQIWTIWQEGGTGMLSAFGVFTYLMGSLSRIFTTLQEVDDKLILYGFVAGFLLNAVLAAQMVWYWRSPRTAGHAGELGGKAREVVVRADEEKRSGGSRTTGAEKSKGKQPSTRRRG